MKKIIALILIVVCHLSFADGCELNRTIRFAGNDWDSNSFSTEVARFIIEHGYGCKTESIRGTTVPLLNALARGDVDINMELWKANNIEIWNKMLATSRVQELKGVSINRATQNFYIPRFVVYGDSIKGLNPIAAKLKKVTDMKRYYKLFRDPANPNKGRFYNCKIGWNCEVTNTKKLAAYGLSKYYVNFRTGSAETLRSEIISALERNKPIFFYYWGPTFLLGKYGDQLMILKEPAYNEKDWKLLTQSKTGIGVTAVNYPVLTIHIAVNNDFIEKTPAIKQFLNLFYMDTDDINDALVFMNDNHDVTGRKAAIAFLKNNRQLWKNWTPMSVAKRVSDALEAIDHKQNKLTVTSLMKLSAIAALVLLLLLVSYIIKEFDLLKRRYIIVFISIAVLTTSFLFYYYRSLLFMATPAQAIVPVQGFIDEVINDLVVKYGDILRHVISYPILYLVGVFERFISNQVSWVLISLLFVSLAFHASRRLGLTLFVLIGCIIIWGMQLWVPTVQTLILIFISIVLTVVIGLPLGIAAGLNQTLYRLFSPVLDVMQTMPSFVYLIPVVMLFGLGTFSGVVATAIYAMPPLIRLAALGVRQVDGEIIEAAKSFGAQPKHILFKVQLPLAMPSIMVGINQAIMMALAMVVIASMIGVKGLGQQVLFGLQQQDMGVGITAGLAIVFVSIMLDRISQAYGHRMQAHYHYHGAK